MDPAAPPVSFAPASAPAPYPLLASMDEARHCMARPPFLCPFSSSLSCPLLMPPRDRAATAIARHLARRPPVGELVSHNILHDARTAPGLAAAAHSLHLAHVASVLERKLPHRPPKEALEGQNILRRGGPTGAARVDELQRHHVADALDRQLGLRPPPAALAHRCARAHRCGRARALTPRCCVFSPVPPPGCFRTPPRCSRTRCWGTRPWRRCRRRSCPP